MSKINELVKQISHGVYVIGVSDGEHQNAFTAAWVMLVSFSPLLLAFSINPIQSIVLIRFYAIVAYVQLAC